MPFGVDLDIGIELYDWSYIRLSYNLHTIFIQSSTDLQEKFARRNKTALGSRGQA